MTLNKLEELYREFIFDRNAGSVVAFGYKAFNKRLVICDFNYIDKPTGDFYRKSTVKNSNSGLNILPLYNINNKGEYQLKDYDADKSLKKLSKLENTIYVRDDENHWVISTDGWVIDCEYGMQIYSSDGIVPNIVYDNIVFNSKDPQFNICYISDNGIRLVKSKTKDIPWNSIKNNYNTDLPLDSIDKFILSDDSSGLAIFHGIPGTGKTYFIRYLISKYIDKKFVYIDYNDFYKLCDNKFFLDDLKNTILVIEDCEGLLKSRDSSDFSYAISNLLNITDGLLGDSLNIKIICTFNTDLKNIDKALTRNGRLKIKYEFKELSNNIANKKKDELNVTTNSNLLCDIYHPDTVNVSTKRKIGF